MVAARQALCDLFWSAAVTLPHSIVAGTSVRPNPQHAAISFWQQIIRPHQRVSTD